MIYQQAKKRTTSALFHPPLPSLSALLLSVGFTVADTVDAEFEEEEDEEEEIERIRVDEDVEVDPTLIVEGTMGDKGGEGGGAVEERFVLTARTGGAGPEAALEVSK
jgi:hypothetical protein